MNLILSGVLVILTINCLFHGIEYVLNNWRKS